MHRLASRIALGNGVDGIWLYTLIIDLALTGGADGVLASQNDI